MSHSPVSITIAADAVADLHHHTSVLIRLPVSDSGKVPMTVTVSVRDITAVTQRHPGASWVRSITPATMRLQPGQTKWITLHIVVPAGQRGERYTNFLARAEPASAHTQGRIGAGVGGTLRLERPGYSAPMAVHVPHAHAAQGPASGGDAGWLVLAVVLVLALALAGLALILRRRHHGVHQ